MKSPLLLIILDGWGVAAPWGGNAIALSRTPHLNAYTKSPASTTLNAAGEAVGLPPEEPGNSEVGHLTIGAGKIVKQDLPLINEAIEDGSFFTKPELMGAVESVKKYHSRLHLVGLTSSGGVHSHINHLYALLELVKRQGLSQAFIHMITDGRDTSPYAGIIYLNRLEQKIQEIGLGTIVTVTGRYYAMDRDARWQRTWATYEAMVQGKGRYAPTAQAAIATAYQESLTDEFIPPTVVTTPGRQPVTIGNNDAVIFFNFRSDRARQLTKAFTLDEFPGFSRDKLSLFFVSMTEYEKGLPVHVAFRPEHVEHPLAEVVSQNGLTQLHVAETEKYAHVTYFINGQREQPFPGEARILVPSPKVATYDLAPQMAARDVGETVTTNLKKGQYDLFIVNFANGDMVGHTGNLKETVTACEAVDQIVGQIVEAAANAHGHVVITADHGNAEQMLNPKTGDIDTSHTTNPVPFVILSADPAFAQPLRSGGGLSDVAPTILSMMGLPLPAEMTGTSLLTPTLAGVH